MVIKSNDRVEFDFIYENKFGKVIKVIDNDIQILGDNKIIYTVKKEKILNKIED